MKDIMIIGSAAFFAVACNRDDVDRTTTTTGRLTPNGTIDIGADPNDGTIDRITQARCARELACNNVGANKKWSDVAACQREIRQNVRGDYRRADCHVVQTDKLQSCIDAIQNEKCDDVFDMTRVTACRKANICKD